MGKDEYMDRWRGRYRAGARFFIKRQLAVGARFTGEDLRLYLQPLIGDPNHHNSWGIMARHAIEAAEREELVERRGWKRMRSRRAKGRATREYRRRHPNDLINVASKVLG